MEYQKIKVDKGSHFTDKCIHVTFICCCSEFYTYCFCWNQSLQWRWRRYKEQSIFQFIYIFSTINLLSCFYHQVSHEYITYLQFVNLLSHDPIGSWYPWFQTIMFDFASKKWRFLAQIPNIDCIICLNMIPISTVTLFSKSGKM